MRVIVGHCSLVDVTVPQRTDAQMKLFMLRAIPPARGKAGGRVSKFAYREFVLASRAILLPILSLLSSNHRNASCAQQPSSSLSYPSLRIRPSFASDQREPSPDASGTCTSFRHMGKTTRRHVAIKHTRVCSPSADGQQTKPAGCERSSDHTVIHTYMLCIPTQAQNNETKKGKQKKLCFAHIAR